MRTDLAVIAEQKAAIAKLDKLRGEWRGTATITGPGGTLKLVQTERVGPMLDGTVMVVEGRGTDEAGKLVFNAFAVISYDAATDQYAMTSWTDGRSGKFPFAASTGASRCPMARRSSTARRSPAANGSKSAAMWGRACRRSSSRSLTSSGSATATGPRRVSCRPSPESYCDRLRK
jgi:hypothetical protein